MELTSTYFMMSYSLLFPCFDFTLKSILVILACFTLAKQTKMTWLAEWCGLFRYWIYVFFGTEVLRCSDKIFCLVEEFHVEQKPLGHSHSMGLTPHITTPLWPASLLTSRSAFSHQHNNTLLMALESFLIWPLPLIGKPYPIIPKMFSYLSFWK